MSTTDGPVGHDDTDNGHGTARLVPEQPESGELHPEPSAAPRAPDAQQAPDPGQPTEPFAAPQLPDAGQATPPVAAPIPSPKAPVTEPVPAAAAAPPAPPTATAPAPGGPPPAQPADQAAQRGPRRWLPWAILGVVVVAAAAVPSMGSGLCTSGSPARTPEATAATSTASTATSGTCRRPT